MNPERELERGRPRSMRPTGTGGDRPTPTTRSMNRHLRPNLEERSHVYQVLEELGRGSFGVTYKAQNVISEENVAVKAVKVSQGSSSSCLCKEGQIMKTLNHPNIVNLVSLMNCGSGQCPPLVLELCHCNLRDVVRQHRDKIGIGHVKCFALELMEGLRHIHSCHVIHRDIKPHNILLTGDGVLKICDFGLATFMRESYSPGVGTRNFMAPEILLETTRYNWAVDIWAAGCTIAELISGQRFIPGKSQEELLANMIYLLGTIDRTTLPQRRDLPLLDRHPLPKFHAQIDRQLARITSDDLAQDFMGSLLQLNPDSRLSASDALSHSFFQCDPRPERLILVADSRDQQGVQVSSEADISVGKEEFPQKISPQAMQNNSEAGHEYHPISILTKSQSANSDTNLMLQDYLQDPVSAPDVISSGMDVQVHHVPPPSVFSSAARDGYNNTTQPQPQAASHAPELLSAAENNAIQGQSQLLPPQGYPQSQTQYQLTRHLTQGNDMAFALALRHHQLVTQGNSISFAIQLRHYQLTHPEQYHNPQPTMQPDEHFNDPYFCDRVNHNSRPY